ncbi:MAG: hypothetical protein FJ297_14755 [Planctomycetes bacterium]|nr:hypothetical protein [Planctomycetota bacterium]
MKRIPRLSSRSSMTDAVRRSLAHRVRDVRRLLRRAARRANGDVEPIHALRVAARGGGGVRAIRGRASPLGRAPMAKTPSGRSQRRATFDAWWSIHGRPLIASCDTEHHPK